MDARTRARIEKAGYRVTTVQEFTGVSDAVHWNILLQLALAKHIVARRRARRWTQEKLAREMGSTQARVAKIENFTPEVSNDLLLRATFALGTTLPELGKIIAAAAPDEPKPRAKKHRTPRTRTTQYPRPRTTQLHSMVRDKPPRA